MKHGVLKVKARQTDRVCVNRHQLHIKYISLLKRMAWSLACIDWGIVINQQCFIVESVMTVTTLFDKVICRFLAKLDGVSIVKCILSKLELGFLGMELNSKLY